LSRAQFAAILLAGAVVRAAALPGPGTGDVTVFKVWSYNAARHGVGEMYGVGGSPPERRLLEYLGTTAVVDYPPLALYELGAAGRLHRLWSAGRFPNNAALNAAVKLPAVAGDVGFLILVFTLARRYFGEASARWAAAAYWLNPAPIIDASVLGYLDMQYVAPAGAAIVAAAHAWPALAGALIAAAILTKAQGVFIAPAVALAIWTCGGADRRVARFVAAAAAALGVATALVAQVVVAGGWPNMLQALSRLAHHDSLSAQACNLWWLVGYVLRVRYSADGMGLWPAIMAPARILGIPRVVELGYPDPKSIGMLLTLAAMSWALWIASRSAIRPSRASGRPELVEERYPQSAMDVWLLAGVAGFLVHAYATLSAQVHENHLFAAVPLLAIAAAGRRGFRPIFLVVSAVVALNLNLFYGFGDDVFALPRATTIIDATVVLALVNCAALLWHARVLRRECSAASVPRRQPAQA
jgi:hypothetical protein